MSEEVAQAGPVLELRVRVENGMLVPEEPAAVPPEGIYIAVLRPVTKDSVDALEAIVRLAEPIGPPDLAENFDAYARWIADDQSSG